MMRKSLAAVLIASLAAGLAAQDSVRREVKLPSGAVVVRRCATWRAEGIVVLPADARDAGPKAPAYFALLAEAMERRLAHVALDSAVLVASYAARVLNSGAVNGVRLVRGSKRPGFDMQAQEAATFSADDPDRVPMPAGMPDSLTVLISFGRRQDGSDFLVSHVRCPVIALPDDPKPEYPVAATLMRSRYRVRVRYAVDTLGAVDPARVTFLDETNDAFVAATMTYLSKRKYLPAEFDGAVERQTLERTILFVPPDEAPADTN